MINRILHSWSFNMKFMNSLGNFGILLAKACKIPPNYPNSFDIYEHFLLSPDATNMCQREPYLLVPTRDRKVFNSQV